MSKPPNEGNVPPGMVPFKPDPHHGSDELIMDGKKVVGQKADDKLKGLKDELEPFDPTKGGGPDLIVPDK